MSGLPQVLLSLFLWTSLIYTISLTLGARFAPCCYAWPLLAMHSSKTKIMALFNWFSGKSERSKSPVAKDSSGSARHSRPTALPASPLLVANTKPVADPTNRSEERKAKRHARREQLYVAVRESMTRAGVLSASYKFKVLSLDQRGDQFLVMMDVHPSLGAQIEKLTESETLIVQTAKTLFGMTVTSVYWRLDIKPGSVSAQPSVIESRASELKPMATSHEIKKSAVPRYEPIDDDEVKAFKQALGTAAASSPAVADASGKKRSGLRSYTLITGFEDTEMPESAAAPALSATQYGELR